MDVVPTDVLKVIFEFLGQRSLFFASLVCREWFHIAYAILQANIFVGLIFDEGYRRPKSLMDKAFNLRSYYKHHVCMVCEIITDNLSRGRCEACKKLTVCMVCDKTHKKPGNLFSFGFTIYLGNIWVCIDGCKRVCKWCRTRNDVKYYIKGDRLVYYYRCWICKKHEDFW